MSRFPIGSRLLLGLALASSAPVVVSAQQATGDTISADDRALHAYALTMGHLQKIKQAAHNLAAFASANPQAAQALDGGSQTLDQQIASIESIPRAKQAITSTGLTVRDFIFTTTEFFNTAIAAATEDNYARFNKTPPPAPYMVNPASLAFLRAHKPEIDALDLGEMMQGGTSPTPDAAAHNPQQP